MSTRILWAVIFILLLIIIFLASLLIFMPGPASQAPPSGEVVASSSTQVAIPAPSTSPEDASPSTSTAPLSASVSVSAPLQGTSVGESFGVSGVAPSGWYFEAVFPIKVIDANDNTIASAQGQAQSDWTGSSPIPFTATITIDPPYHGPATLVLLRDNPSGLPQNDDSVEVPIVVQ